MRDYNKTLEIFKKNHKDLGWPTKQSLQLPTYEGMMSATLLQVVATMEVYDLSDLFDKEQTQNILKKHGLAL